jgi:hypothetical protein
MSGSVQVLSKTGFLDAEVPEDDLELSPALVGIQFRIAENLPWK